jgi:hypothetical protein
MKSSGAAPALKNLEKESSKHLRERLAASSRKVFLLNAETVSETPVSQPCLR